MIVRTRRPANERRDTVAASRPPLRRRAMCQFIALALFGVGSAHAATPPPFSAAWLATKQAGASQPATPPTPGSAGNADGSVFTPGNVMLQQRVQQSIANLDAAAQAVAAQMSAQKSAQLAAQQLTSTVPNGLAAGGLTVDTRVSVDPSLWQNANAPTQSTQAGRTTVEVKQTAAKAIMSWESFNVGRDTTLHFDQTGGTQTDGGNQWIALNRIADPSGRPSQILGQIKAEGTVYLLNRNGVVFGGGSQVDTHSLMASSLDLFSADVSRSNAFFLKYGIANTTDSENLLGNGAGLSLPGFLVSGPVFGATEAPRGGITIEKGAFIKPTKDGFAILAAPAIVQAGAIVADDAQVLLAAAPGLQWTAGATGAASVGVSGAPSSLLDSRESIVNTGLVQARRGAVRWIGQAMRQDGTVVASTSLSHPGSLAFDPVLGTGNGIAFGGSSVTTVLPEKDGETTSSAPSADAAFKTSTVSVGAKATLESGALMEVPAGNVTFSQDAYLAGGAIVDVSGLANVVLPLSALLVTIPRIGLNELADSPLLRNSILYTAKNVTVDSTRTGTRADGLDWVGSPVLNVAGYVTNVPRSVDELMTRSGNIAFGMNAVVRTGAQLRLEGGFINYLPGTIQSPRLQGTNGLLYDIASADPTVQYAGFAGVYDSEHARWGVTETYNSPLLASVGRQDTGFIRGADAGTLSFGVGNTNDVLQFVIDGDISAHAYAGREQVGSGQLPLAGTLDIRSRDLQAIGSSDTIAVARDVAVNYVIRDVATPIESYVPTFDASSPWPTKQGDPNDPNNPFWWRTLSTAMIDNAGLRRLRLVTGGSVLIEDNAHLHVADGGSIDIVAVAIDAEGSATARGGHIGLTLYGQPTVSPLNVPASMTVGAHALLDASGLWANDTGRTADALAGRTFIDGGDVSLVALKGTQMGNELGTLPDATGSIALAPGSVIDVSSGGYVATNGQLATNGVVPLGRGGDVTIDTHADGRVGYGTAHPDALDGGGIAMDGTILAEGFQGGGTLTLHAPRIQIGGEASEVSSASTLYLDPAMFSSLGFSRYTLIADTDALVAPGSTVTVRPRYLIGDQQALLSLPTGARVPHSADVSLGELDPFLRYQNRGTDDGLSISAGDYRRWTGIDRTPFDGVTGAVDIGEGASIAVDAGDTIALSSVRAIRVDGTLTAAGGSVSLENLVDSSTNPLVDTPDRSVWLGASSVLDVSGVSLRDPGAGATVQADQTLTPRRDGVVLDGGSIRVVSDRNLAAAQGAQLRLSGAADTYDLPAEVRRGGIDTVSFAPTPVWSNAGSLLLGAGRGLFFDGSIVAQGGSPSASGGALRLQTIRPFPSSGQASPSLVLRQSGYLLPADATPDSLDQAVDGPLAAPIQFAMDRLTGSGIDDVQVGSAPGSTNATSIDVPLAALLFAGDVDVSLARSFRANAAVVGMLPLDAASTPAGIDVVGAGHVTIDAPYVSFANTNANVKPLSVSGDGSLDIHADMIDLGGRVSLTGIGHAAFDSRGDIRLSLPASDAYLQGKPVTGWLYTTGDLDFTGTRVYPATDYRFLIDAAGPANDATVAFHPAATTDTSTPLSAGGVLAVAAAHIEQGGTIWVPSGALSLGSDDPAATLAALNLDATMPLAATRDVHLAPGSRTSVSLDGAIVPYGVTTDGKEWRYDADPSANAPSLTAPPEKTLSIAGDAVAVDAGATVDLSGGGHVQSIEWIPGTGGSRDVLAQYRTDYSTSAAGTQVSQYTDGRAIYAIVPGYDAPLAAHDAALEKGAGAGPSVGQGVYLSGVPGLADGVYTLMPARYATLPGAFRVVQDTAVHDPVVGMVSTSPDGTHVVGGYFTDTLTGARDARSSAFLVQSAATWGQYSEYTTTSADTFFPAQAARNGDVSPRIGADAGRLTLAATAALSLGATLDAAPAKGGRGSQVDIAGEAIQVLGAGSDARDGYLHVAADDLSRLGAGSLLIGGKRQSTADGDRIDVLASDVLVSNDAAHPLQGADIILAANGTGGGVALAAGSVVRATATTDAAVAPLTIGQLASDGQAAVSGDGALVRVSGLDAAPIVRVNVTGLDGPAGTPGGNLSIGDAAVLDAARSLSMDATGVTSLAPGATLAARSIDITAGRIGLVGGDASAPGTPGELLIGPRTLAQFAGSDETTLRGRAGIDLYGDLAIVLPHALTLSAPTLTSDGGTATVTADTLILANDTGATAPAATAGNGAFVANVRQFALDAGAIAAQGLGSFDVQATGGIATAGVGSLDLGAADVTFATPRFLVGAGATTRLHTTGAIDMIRAGAASPMARVAGGKLFLAAGTIDIGTDVVAAGGTIDLEAAQGDVHVGNGARLDVAGLSLPFNDVAVHVPAGTVDIEAATGNVVLDAGTTVDLRGADDGGNAGRLVVRAPNGSATLMGDLLGHATAGYLGGNLALDTSGAVDMTALTDRLAAGSMDGSTYVHTRSGDLAVDAGHTLRARRVQLTADGGSVRADGTIDTSGASGGTITLYGARGVDVDGTLDTHASMAGREGGDIVLGTSGTGDGTFNDARGYQNVQAADAGHIRLGDAARIEQGGDAGDGALSLRAPVLADGDVPVDIAATASLAHTRQTTLEAYAAWDTRDASVDPSRHFDGLVDAAGWFSADPATGRPVLVAGGFVDADGNAVPDPDRSNATQVADYLARYRFTPDTANADHQSFYGYAGGDATAGPGALMGFIQSPGFTFESRLAALSNLHVRPGVELRNGDATVNGGDISVLTNWNLGAGTVADDGTRTLAYRYGLEAPVLNLRASHDLDIRASITDGFFQVANAGGRGGAAPPLKDYADASADYQALLDTSLGVDGFPDLFATPAEFTDEGSLAAREYYGQYHEYVNYLLEPLPQFPGYRPVEVIVYGLGYGFVTPVPDAPVAPVRPLTLNDYPSYLARYPSYLIAAATLSDFSGTLSVPDTFDAVAPPPTTLDVIDTSAPLDNSPSPHGIAANPLPILSATLTGGNSSSYRFVAGADAGSVDPLAVVRGTGDIRLDGHTEYLDPLTGRTMAIPTLVRTGTGDIDLVAAGDIRWLDERAPAAIYTAGEPAEGTTTESTADILHAANVTNLAQNNTPAIVLSGAVNPEGAGHVVLDAGGDIVGIQSPIDTVGDITGQAGTPMGQYWWQWMQTTNSADRSAINFGAFDQGVMSAGGNVDVTAGGNIRQLSVSLPTTWTLVTDTTGATSVRTIGGGDLDVNAGGDILSGSYFVARGTGTIRAGGRIGSDFSSSVTGSDGVTVDTPVSTLLALQDAQLDVQAGGSTSIGGIFNPSWFDSSAINELAPAGHADAQTYSARSRVDITALQGDVTYGDLASPIALFTAGIASVNASSSDTAGVVLPATVNLVAASGSLDLNAPGELFPSNDGNLGLLAQDSVTFSLPSSQRTIYHAWGLIDAPLTSLASPLNLLPLTDTSGDASSVRTRDGYLLSSLGTYVHAQDPWHADDTQPVRVYAIQGDIVNGTGGGENAGVLVSSKAARIVAGRDIVDLAYLGQQLRASDISIVQAGRDIRDTALSTVAPGATAYKTVLPVIAQAGPGTLHVQAGRDIGTLASQNEFYALGSDVRGRFIQIKPNGASDFLTGIDTIGNSFNPWLPVQGASILTAFGVAPGLAMDAFISRYVDPSAATPVLSDGAANLVSFVEDYDAGLKVDTGLLVDQVTPTYTVDQAWARFQALPVEAKTIFVQKTLFRVLAQVGKDYADPASPFVGRYERGYAAINTLFPASLGYTANGLGGGINGAEQTIATGDLDIRGSTIQTQRGGDVSILAPGGQALLGSVSAPPYITFNNQLLAGPNTQGILTLREGDISVFTDRSTLLAQSRIFTEQGGDLVMWSSNGDINAGKGAKTTSDIPPARYLCTIDAWCFQDPSGQVAGAGIATLQTIPGAAEGSVYLLAPRGTVDAGDAGIRVSGNLVIAAAQVANADNVQVKGEAVGLPVVQSVNIGALNAASAAANAASKAAEDVVRQQQSDSRDRLPSIISVQVLGGEPSASVDGAGHGTVYDPSSPVKVFGADATGALTPAERARMAH